MAIDEKAIFVTAMGLPNARERKDYLQVACAGHPELLSRLQELLAAHEESQGPLDRPAPAPGLTVDAPLTEKPGTVIGPYKLLQQIGEGGMGTVFMAEQTQPVQRKVALKLIKPGMDSRQVIARFEAERQALAIMDHVNIARVFDAGATASGRPYFVMELVHGVPITKYCDDNRLTPRQRLELFVPVCQAIQHAHQKGIIHRDVKPSNVMITLYDGKPVPKVIDFGVAKAIEQRLTERTLFTQYGTMVGTPTYMSPEQAEMSALGADTRSDIFSLGVLLYELLTGSTPLTSKRVREAAYGEVLRMIREEEAPKPSARLSDSGAALASISAQRHMEPAKLTKLMRGELDWIVMKALEKDRNRRYETANGFAADVQRYLNDEAVEACPPSAWYRLRKFARRHRVAFRAAAAFAGLLILGVVISTWQAVRATVAEGQANVDRNRAVEAEEEAKTSAATARDEAQKAKQSEAEARAVLEFFQEKVLAAARPKNQKGGLGIEASIRAAVDAAEPQIGPAFQDRPLVEASIRFVLGETYRYLGETALAIRQHERSRQLRLDHLGPDHPDTLSSMGNLALVYKNAGKLDLAVPLYELTLEKRKAKLGPDHPDTLTSMNNLAMAYKVLGKLDLAVPLFEVTLEKRKAKLGPDHQDTLLSMNNLASAYFAASKFDQALPLFEQALEKRKATLGADHPDTLTSVNDLATAYLAADNPDRGLRLLEETLEKKKATIGPDHPDTLTMMGNLAYGYYVTGKLNQALALWEETLEKQKAKLGPDHPNTLITMNNLANAYQADGKLDQALSLFEETLKKYQAKFGPDHPGTLTCMNGLARAYQADSKLDRALPLYKLTLEKRKAKLGPDHPQTLQSMTSLGWVHVQAKRYGEAELLYKEAIALARGKFPAGSLDVASPLDGLGYCLLQAEKPAEAEPLLRETMAIRAKKAPDAWTTFYTQSMLGGSLLAQKKYAEAEPLLLAAYEGMRQREAKIPREHKARLAESLERLVQLYEATGNEEKAAEWRKRREQPKVAPVP